MTTLIQYWLFVLYDYWAADLPFGRLAQEHEADWEAVTVGLSSTE